ncbi:MAG: prolipoprotein diacylglyceryl transferase [Oscillospiraceae bacterium]|nr:prolipoprotein diacylglyceryl transferase [Oscillospiraceae bacterium]
MSHVSFPGLGLEFDINRVAFTVGGFEIYWYGILIALGMFIGVILGQKNAKRFGIDEDKLYDVIIWGAIGAILGGRTFYVLFADDYEVKNIWQFLNLREGGTAFYGILTGALLTSFIVCKINKTRYLCLLDNLALGFLVGQDIGRWGNFFNQELFGTNTDLPWGMYSDTIARYISREGERLFNEHGIVLTDGPVHPTFLYESIWCVIGVFVISYFIRHRQFDGEIGLRYLLWNGIGRAFCESLRTDALFVGNVRISQAICITYATISAIALIVIKRKIKNSNDPDYLKPYALTREYLMATGQITEEPADVTEELPEDAELLTEETADVEPVSEPADAETDAPAEEDDAAEDTDTAEEEVSEENASEKSDTGEMT